MISVQKCVTCDVLHPAVPTEKQVECTSQKSGIYGVATSFPGEETNYDSSPLILQQKHARNTLPRFSILSAAV